MKLSALCAFCATLGPIGYLAAPGTMATLLTLPLVYALRSVLPSDGAYACAVGFIFFCSIGIINRALAYYNKYNDPAEIVLDEVVGCLITFIGIPLSTDIVLIGFMLFRFFDICKIFGVGYMQRFIDGWGIMLDDALAALLANCLLRFLM